MRIGIDVRLWNETGVGRYIRNLVHFLYEKDNKNEYILFCRKGDHELLSKYTKRSTWKIVETSIHWHSMQEQLLLPFILYKEKPDLMHFPYFSVPILYRKPYVVTLHDLIIYHRPTGKASTLPKLLYVIKRIGYKVVINFSIRNAKKIIVPLHATKQDVIKTFGISSEKISVTPEGVDATLLETKGHAKFNATYNKYFLYVGNVYPHKNVDTLVKAFLTLQKVDKDVQLFMVGKQDFFYNRLREQLHKYNVSTIKLMHSVSDDALQYLYTHAIAVVAPSYIEGFGLVPLEAMATSCIIIASDIPAHREVCGDAAIYFDPHHVEDLQLGLLKALTLKDEERKKITAKGLHTVKSFSWKEMTDSTIEIYEDCDRVRPRK